MQQLSPDSTRSQGRFLACDRNQIIFRVPFWTCNSVKKESRFILHLQIIQSVFLII